MATVNRLSALSWWSRFFPLRVPGVRKAALAIAFLLLNALYSPAQGGRPTESQVKAAYLYNFGKFVKWPQDRATAADFFGICILGKDPFGEVLDATVRRESIDGKQIKVQRLSRIQEATSCSVLFVSSSEENHLVTILPAAQRLSLLTVSDIKQFSERGGIVGFVSQQDRIRFEVNREAAEQSHLLLSSDLLKVAVKVFDKGRH